ncbi:hypothetical protein ACFVZ3_06585 [Kitasatospora purpeofusca]|uniref:hypothetical protein n=1 Tax=Kitasatospora purpeofusca TaxID=67352 RepID=UPI0036CEA5E1
MNTRRRTGGPATAAACSLLGIPVSGAAGHLVEHRALLHEPLCLGIFTAFAFTALAVADRAVNHRAGRPTHHRSTPWRPSGPGSRPFDREETM